MAIPAGAAGFTNVVDVISIDVADSVLAYLVDFGCGDLDRFCRLVPGDIAWDQCDCGLFAQTITSTYPSNTFPTSAADTPYDACGPLLIVYAVTAELVRCAPTVDDEGTAPTCTELETAARTLECDRQALRLGVVCALTDLRDTDRIIEFTVGDAATSGPQGGCVGVSLAYRIAVSNVCCD